MTVPFQLLSNVAKKKNQKKNVIEGATAMQLEREFVFQGGYAAYRYAQPATATAAAYSDR